jgi:hypothetical protein
MPAVTTAPVLIPRISPCLRLRDYTPAVPRRRRTRSKKIVTRREALAKELQDLQERYTKAGKLEEAIAIRDYIRAGMPGLGEKRGALRVIAK